MAEASQPSPTDEPSHERRPAWVLTDEEVHSRLSNWPLLRLLWGEPTFRYAFLACVAVVLLVGLCLPRIWIVTPKGFLPVVRVSALDKLEARIHGKLALSKDAAGQVQDAMYHWRVAVANDPSSVPLICGYLSNLVAQPPRSPERSRVAVQQSFWLLRLGQTNYANASVALRALEHYRYDELALYLVTNSPPPLPLEFEMVALRSQLRIGRGDAYAVNRARLGDSPEVKAELALFDAAWAIGWGGGPAPSEARATLLAAESDPARAVTALELQLLIAARQGDLTLFGRALNRLRDVHADTPSQHAAYWTLLRLKNRRDEAVKLALDYADPPVSSSEIMRVATAQLGLGLTNHATKYLEHFVPQLGATADTWATLGGLLAEQRRWSDLRGLAVELRQNPLAKNTFTGYSHFLDGLASYGEFAKTEALRAFSRVPQNPFTDDQVAFNAAQVMMRLGAAEAARDLLLPRAGRLGSSLEYWQFLVRVSYELRDSVLLLRAARAAHKLAPDRADTLTDLSAALLIERSEPAETLDTTRRLVQATPRSIAARMNHALALLQAGQKSAARGILLTFEPAQLSDVARTMFFLAEAQLHDLDGNTADALAALDKVATTHLFPRQIEFLNELRTRLEKQLGLPAASGE